MDKLILKLLESKASVLASLFIAAVGVYLAIRVGAAPGLPEWALGGSLAAAIVFGSLTAMNVVNAVRERQAALRARDAVKARVAAYLDTLSHDEHRVLSYLVQRNQRSFNSSLLANEVALLVQKGLVKRGGGPATSLPHQIPEHVWDELVLRSSEFNSCDPSGPPPWARRFI